MTVIQYSVLILIGLASGFAVASGIFAFITMLGIIPRLAARTKTANHVVWYETMIIAGGALGNIWIVFEIPMPLTSIFLAVYGLFAGVYVGCLVMALAEMLRVIPILVNRLQIKEAFYLIPLAIAIGKITGFLSRLKEQKMNQDNIDIQEVLQEKEQKKKDEKYNAYVKNHTPKKSWCINLLKAYAIGGFICVVGQALSNAYMSLGMEKETAGLYTTLSLIFLSVLFTGLNLYQKLANFAGAGTIVPITGFANSVAAPAIEFKEEGWVFGVGCKIFTIAGPVILYGVFCSWVLGVIYWVW